MSVSVRRGALRFAWIAAVLPIVAWTAHLTATAALVHESCTRTRVKWAMHGLTLGTALICIGCALVGVALRRRAKSETGNGPYRFLAALVVGIALTNFVLIVWEGAYTEFLSSCH